MCICIFCSDLIGATAGETAYRGILSTRSQSRQSRDDALDPGGPIVPLLTILQVQRVPGTRRQRAARLLG
jgi:hypothetical protein